MDTKPDENPHNWVSESFAERLFETFGTRDVMEERVRNFFFNRYRATANVTEESKNGNCIVVDVVSDKGIVISFLERLPPETRLKKIDEFPDRKYTRDIKLEIDWSDTEWNDKQIHDMKLDLVSTGLEWLDLEKQVLKKYLKDSKEKDEDIPLVALKISLTKWA